MKALNKKGVLGLDTVKAVIISLLILAVLAIASILALVSLQNSNIIPSTQGSLEQNRTAIISGQMSNIINNVTTGQSSFFTNAPTFFVLLGVVVLILIISIVIVAVTRFSPGTREEL